MKGGGGMLENRVRSRISHGAKLTVLIKNEILNGQIGEPLIAADRQKGQTYMILLGVFNPDQTYSHFD